MKKFLALALAAMMLLSLVACGGGTSSSSSTPADGSSSSSSSSSSSDSTSEPADQTSYENKVILGDSTELGGDFRYPGWGGNPNAADQGVWFMTAGYAAMETDQHGVYQWNPTAVKDHSMTENEDGTATFHVEINHDLTYSDGTPITAKDYLAQTLAFSTEVAMETGHSGQSGQTFVGFEDFHAYTGDNEGEEFPVDPDDPSLGVITATKVFKGVRLIDDYTYEVTVTTDFYPYYFAETYAALQPVPLAMWLGEGGDIMDDGEGCYLSDSFYEKSGEGDDATYNVAAVMEENRFDTTKFPFSGPYMITEWDEGTKQATMTINPAFKGNFEGQVASIETVVATRIVSETQTEQLKTGVVDVLSALTGGTDVTPALDLVNDGSGQFAENHYQRAGYGKLRFDCDFGPTMFQEVRQALAYLVDRNTFCQTFTGGYGTVVDGPYAPCFAMWQAVQDEIDLIDYSFSPDNAKKVLEDGGWIYNSKGEPYVEGAEGVDAVRYKKLTEEEANALDGANKTYASVANTDGVEYKTMEVNGEYYMPLAINWFGTEQNNITDMLTTSMANSSDVAAAGMVVRATQGDFNTLLGNIYRDSSLGYLGTPTYGLYNLATGWNDSVYDQAFAWSHNPKYFSISSNHLYDPYDVDFPYDSAAEKLTYEEAVEASGDKLGMDYLSMAMVYNATTEDEYNHWWMGYIERFNELMADIPLYSNIYYDAYNTKIENFATDTFFGQYRAILYANVKGH